jgi:hypothetical protein
MADHLDLQRVGPCGRLRLEDRVDGRNGDGREDQQRNDRPRDLERRVAVDVLGLGLSGAMPELEEGVEEYALDENEDEPTGPEQDCPERVNVSIDVSVIVKDRVGVVPAGDDKQRQGDRQRGLSQPARAGMKRHAQSFYRRSERGYRLTLGANCVEQRGT